MRKLVLIFVVIACVSAATAFAAGGKDINSAPAVQFGAQQFGNTASDGGQRFNDCEDATSWWNMDVTAGDRISIDLDAPLDHSLYVFPVGTTDFTVEETYSEGKEEAAQRNGRNGKARLVLTAGRSGTMPMVFQACNDNAAGPYSFTAHVQHALVLAVPPMRRLRRNGTVTVGVRDAEGNPINSGVTALIEVRHDGKWGVVGAEAVQSGTAIVNVKIPRSFVGQRKRLRAAAGGPGYVTERSSTQRVEIRRARRR